MGASARAQDVPEWRWILRGAPGAFLAAGGDEAGDPNLTPPIPPEEILPETLEQTINNGWGVVASVEYLMSRHFGLELSGLFGNFEGKFQINRDGIVAEPTEDIGFTSFTLGPNYHFTPRKRIDYFLGVYLAYYDYEDLTIQFPDHGITLDWTFEDTSGWGWRGGLDWAFGDDSPWVLTANVYHHRGEFDVHPVMINVGVGRRF
jgi:hypothetical protein